MVGREWRRDRDCCTFLKSTEKDYLRRLIEEIPWIRGKSVIEDSGVVIEQTRSMYCADNETLTYTYSGETLLHVLARRGVRVERDTSRVLKREESAQVSI